MAEFAVTYGLPSEDMWWSDYVALVERLPKVMARDGLTKGPLSDVEAEDQLRQIARGYNG